ncbi:MAG: T9SS type A sorting domain-containing protein [Bacteroidetes bacterium]|nr:T9SS type A sorting domain-containing protein [Bacteroidota bacterium]
MKQISIYLIVTIILSTFIGFSLNAQNSWIQKSDFGGLKRDDAVGISTSSKGYIGTGGNLNNYYADFWEYDPLTDDWTQKATFPGNPRKGAVGFSVGGRVYIGTGEGEGLFEDFKDFWEYNPSSDTWSQIPDLPDNDRSWAFSFSIGNKGYVGGGLGYNVTKDKYNSFWEYNVTTRNWSKKTDFPGGAPYDAVGFAIGNKGYVSADDGTFWEYDPVYDVWTQKSNMDAPIRGNAVGFAIGNIGFVCTGSNNGQYFADVNRYDPGTDTWTNNWQENFTGDARYGAVGFAIGNYAYLGTGYTNHTPYYFKDFWRFSGTQLQLEVSPSNSEVSALAGNTAFSVNSNSDWIATSDVSWCIVTPSGSGNGTIVAIYTENTLAYSRTANIQVKFRDYDQPVRNVTVTQKRSSSGTENTTKDVFQIFPNPTKGIFKIASGFINNKQFEVTVTDISGREIFKKQLQGQTEYEIDLSNENQGCYAIILKFDDQILVRKVVIIK